jgi:carbon-monoxide dehydrogenase small subunit
VLIDGNTMSACLVPAVFIDGASVRTIEGLSPEGGPLTPLQEAFIRHGGFQCGICTPGQIMSATGLLAENPHPTELEVKEWMMGNLCRCTGYYKIVESILAAAEAGSGEIAASGGR